MYRSILYLYIQSVQPHFLPTTYNYTDMAKEFLNGSDSVDSLIELAKSEHYEKNTTIQSYVLNIVHHYQKGSFLLTFKILVCILL